MELQIITKKKSDISIYHQNGQFFVNVDLYFKSPEQSETYLMIDDNKISCDATNTVADTKRKCLHFSLELVESSDYPTSISLHYQDMELNCMDHTQVRLKLPEVMFTDMIELQKQIEGLSEFVSNQDSVQPHEEMVSLLQNKSDVTHNHEVLDIEGLTDMFTLKAPVHHTHTVDTIEGLEDKINAMIDSKVRTDDVNEIVQKALDKRLDLKKYQAMENIIKKKLYMHVGKIETYPQENDSKETVIWVKMLSNIMFEDTPSVENAVDDTDDKEATLEPLSTNIQIDTVEKLNSQQISLTFESSVPLQFTQCIILPQGPKSLQDYPIGNKMYEWIESEIHMQFTTSVDLSKLSLHEKKISIGYQNVEIVNTHIKNHTQADWQHYYLNYMNSSVPK